MCLNSYELQIITNDYIDTESKCLHVRYGVFTYDIAVCRKGLEKMSDILEQFPTQEAFNEYWKENYIELTYEDVKAAYEEFVLSAEKHIFINDYEESGAISREDFMENLAEAAQFTFQDTLTEVFYDKNPDLYETAFALYEEGQLSGQGDKNIAIVFHEEYNRLYREFLMQMYDDLF